MFLVPLKVTVPPVLLDPPHANAAIRTAPHAAAQRSDLPVLDITATSHCVLHQICPVSRGQNGTRPSRPQDAACLTDRLLALLEGAMSMKAGVPYIDHARDPHRL